MDDGWSVGQIQIYTTHKYIIHCFEIQTQIQIQIKDTNTHINTRWNRQGGLHWVWPSQRDRHRTVWIVNIYSQILKFYILWIVDWVYWVANSKGQTPHGIINIYFLKAHLTFNILWTEYTAGDMRRKVQVVQDLSFSVCREGDTFENAQSGEKPNKCHQIREGKGTCGSPLFYTRLKF